MKLLWHRLLTYYFSNLKIKQKLLLSYFILIILPLGLLTAFSYRWIAGTIEKQTINSTSKVLEQTGSFLDYKLANIIEISKFILANDSIRQILVKDTDDYGIGEQIDDAKTLLLLIKSFQENKDIHKIKLYVKDGLLYSNENINIFNIKGIENESWYRKVVSMDGRICWIKGGADAKGKRVVSLCRLFKNPSELNQIVGVICIDLLEEDLYTILKKANLTRDGIVYLVNDEDELISLSDNSAAGSDFIDRDYNEAVLKNGAMWEKIDINGRSAITGFNRIENADWKIVAVIPLKEILDLSIRFRNYILILMIIIGAVAYIIAYYISSHNTRRISLLIETMRGIKPGNLDPRVVVSGKDEIGEIEENYNAMIGKMGLLVSQIRNAELKALQAQINPHFLYNTLDLINWMAVLKKAPDISSLVNLLAKYYKLSLSGGRDIIPIGDEVMHAGIYLQIQNRRFKDCIKLELDIDESVYEYSMLKLVLQPLIENAIFHGILEKDIKQGVIKIAVRLEDGLIVFCIQDDGIGMTEEKVKMLMSEKPSNEGHSYGIKNINERIKLYYGPDYALFYTSTPGKGTTVELSFPAIKTPCSK